MLQLINLRSRILFLVTERMNGIVYAWQQFPNCNVRTSMHVIFFTDTLLSDGIKRRVQKLERLPPLDLSRLHSDALRMLR